MESTNADHAFSVRVATKYGIEAAIILHDLEFWVRHNAANGRAQHDGKYWTYNSVKAFGELYPYMSESTIKRVLKKLENDGLIEIGNYNKAAYDRTKWYTLTNKGWAEVAGATASSDQSIGQNDQMDLVKMADALGQSDQPIPDTNKDTPTDTNKDIGTREQKEAHGEFGNVYLTATEFAKVQALTPEWPQLIERLSAYKEQSGKRYKSDYAALLNWHRRDAERNAPRKRSDVNNNKDFADVCASMDASARVWRL